MWLFTKRAFLSAVEFDPNMDKTGKKPEDFPTDPTGLLLVRARVKADLEDLRDAYPALVIEDDPYADYEFRAIVPRYDFAQYLINQVWEMDYQSHFKEVVKANSTQSSERYTAMMKVWTAMQALQPATPYGGYGGTGYYSGTTASTTASTSTGTGYGKEPVTLDGYDDDDEWYENLMKQKATDAVPPAKALPAVPAKAQGPAKGSLTLNKGVPAASAKTTTPAAPAKPVDPTEEVRKMLPAKPVTPGDVAKRIAEKKAAKPVTTTIGKK